MAIEYDLVEGLDPTPLGAISASQLLQMVRQAAPNDKHGFIIYSATKPDVTNNPRYKRYFWVNISTLPNTAFYFDTTIDDFAPITASVGSVSTASIAQGAVTPAKIEPGAASTFLQTDAGGNVVWNPFAIADNSFPISRLLRPANGAYKILRVNPTGDALEWSFINPIDYLDDNTIPVEFLERGNTAGYIISLDSNLVPVWSAPPTFSIPDGSIAPVKLTEGQPKQALQTTLDGSATEWSNGSTMTVVAVAGVGPTWDALVIKPTGTRWRAFELMFIADVVGSNSPPFGAMKIDFTYQTAPLVDAVPGSGSTGTNYTDIISVVGSPVWAQAGMMAPQLQDVAQVTFRATATVNGGTTIRVGSIIIVKAHFV